MADGPLIFIGLVQAAIFLWQGIVFRGTLRAINRQANQMVEAGKQTDQIINTMRDTAEKQLRPYVCITSAIMEFKRPDTPKAKVRITNCGQTPAYNVRQWIHIWEEDFPLKVVLPEPPFDFVMSNAVLPPQGHNFMEGQKAPPVTRELVRQLGTPQCTIYVYGHIRYVDIFGKERYTKYRLIYGGPEKANTFTQDGILCGELRPDVEGNEAT